MRRYNHVIFDLDHTLWDFERNSRLALSELYGQYGMEESTGKPFEFFMKRYRKHNDECWTLYQKGKMDKMVLRGERFRRAFKDIGEERSALVPEWTEAYLEIAPRKPHLMDGAEQLLKELSEEGMELHMLTNGFREVQTVKLKHSGLDRYFNRFYSPEDLGVKKPHPDAFTQVLEDNWARAEETLMVGDDLKVDVMASQRLGMAGVYYNPDVRRHRGKPTFEIKQLSELTPIATQRIPEL